MQTTDAVSYKCPCCASNLSFSSETQKMACPSCSNEFTIEQLSELYGELENEQNGESIHWELGCETEDTDVFICPSCGAQITSDGNTIATECLYCGSKTVISQRATGELKPDLIIPFKLNKDDAKAAFKNFCKGKLLAPKFFSEESTLDSLTGVYVPFWLFDCDADASVSYDATTITCWSTASYDYTKTSHFFVKRAGTLAVEMLPVDGSTKMDDAYMEAIEPFDYSAAVPFNAGYLSGYFADKYDVSSELCIPRANERVSESILDAFAATASQYATKVKRSSNIQVGQGKISYALMPVWVLNTSYKGEKFTFMMNGQSGKLVGRLPCSTPRYLALLGAVGAVALAVAQLFILL